MLYIYKCFFPLLDFCVNLVYACCQRHALSEQKLEKEPECMICNLSFHALINLLF